MIERLKNLAARYYQTAFLFFIGLMVIVYAAIAVLYLQQAPQQKNLESQITKLTTILRNPMPSADALIQQRDADNLALAPIADNDTIAMLVGLAREKGIEVGEAGQNFRVPVPSHGAAAVSGGSYQLTSFRGIAIQGDNTSVWAFVSALDSGELLPNLVLTRVSVDEVQVTVTGQDAERRNEFRAIVETVKKMMEDNHISRLPHPVSYDLGRASNHMGDDPDTSGLFEGFPDSTTTVTAKGYTGNATTPPRPGYMLWNHDKIQTTGNSSLYSTTNYTPALLTTYYYTAEEDGSVRQWDRTNVILANEYVDSNPIKTELTVSLDIDIYFKPK